MRKFVKIGFIAVFAAIAGYGIYVNQKTDVMSDLMLANVEALADDNEYVIGPTGRNWKEYRIECTRTTGFDYILVYTTTYTYWKDACGSGLGFCFSPAGC